MVMTMGIEPALERLERLQASVPRAGLMMMPATPCSRIEQQHLVLALGILVGVGEDRHEAELVERILDADGELGEEGVRQVAR